MLPDPHSNPHRIISIYLGLIYIIYLFVYLSFYPNSVLFCSVLFCSVPFFFSIYSILFILSLYLPIYPCMSQCNARLDHGDPSQRIQSCKGRASQLTTWQLRRDPQNVVSMDLDLQPGKTAESLQKASAGAAVTVLGSESCSML